MGLSWVIISGLVRDFGGSIFYFLIATRMQRAGCIHKSRGSPKIDHDFSALLRDFRGNIKRGSKLFIKLVYVLFAGSISSAPLGFPLLVCFLRD
jgi:hypothetical protein